MLQQAELSIIQTKTAALRGRAASGDPVTYQETPAAGANDFKVPRQAVSNDYKNEPCGRLGNSEFIGLFNCVICPANIHSCNEESKRKVTNPVEELLKQTSKKVGAAKNLHRFLCMSGKMSGKTIYSLYGQKRSTPKSQRFSGVFLELVSRFGLPTSSLPMKCSTY